MPNYSPLFPEIEPFQTGFLGVSDIHTLYYERVGNPYGVPVLFVHGGPGGGLQESDRRFFDPQKFHVILFDQRGCGKSTPHAELEENTTADLIEDIERLREHLGIERWIVFGGSWGSTLSLAYAQAFPDRVMGLVLRGIFLCRRSELKWFYQEGAGAIWPEDWQGYIDHIPDFEHDNLMLAYHRRLTSTDETIRLQAARMWSRWEMATSKFKQSRDLISHAADSHFALAFARIENHYFVNGIFMEDGQLLKNAHRLSRIPGFIVQGRYDVVCPPTSAWELHKAWPASNLTMVEDAGHSATEPGIIHHLIDALDKIYNRLA
jgi:proline iminopeptidase